MSRTALHILWMEVIDRVKGKKNKSGSTAAWEEGSADMLMESQHQDENPKKTSRKKKSFHTKGSDRSEKIEMLKRRVQSGFYNCDDVIEKVVKRLTEEI